MHQENSIKLICIHNVISIAPIDENHTDQLHRKLSSANLCTRKMMCSSSDLKGVQELQ